MRLAMLGWTQQEISDRLKELWPEAKGTHQTDVGDFLRENENFSFSLKTELAKGHKPGTIATRRHLTSSQRAMLAVDVLPMLEKEARERQREAGREHGRGQNSFVKELTELSEPQRATQQAAEMWLACYTQEEIAGAVGVDQSVISRHISELCNLDKWQKSMIFATYQDPEWKPPLFDVWC